MFANSPAAAIHPACLPITSKTKTLVEVLHIDLISKEASLAEIATYFATEPKPGQLSVTAKSLSIVLGTAIAFRSYPYFSAAFATLRQVSAESLPPL